MSAVQFIPVRNLAPGDQICVREDTAAEAFKKYDVIGVDDAGVTIRTLTGEHHVPFEMISVAVRLVIV